MGPRLTWPQAVVAAAVLFVIGALVYAGKDTGALVTSGLAILGALGMIVKQGTEVKERADAVQQQTNGNTRELLAIIRSQQEQIAELSRGHQDDLKQLGLTMAAMQPAQIVAAGPLPVAPDDPNSASLIR